METLHVHSPPVTITLRRVLRCPRCRVKRRAIVQGFEWYGPRVTCCSCGAGWGDDARPSKPDARRATWARETWRKPSLAVTVMW